MLATEIIAATLILVYIMESIYFAKLRCSSTGLKPFLFSFFLFFLLFCFVLFPFSVGRGWTRENPAKSCKDIRDLGLSKGDGEYWIDPGKTGNPLKVFCDMTTYGGNV